jgi:hypothetical protein
MRKKKPLFLCLLLLITNKIYVFSQNEAWDVHVSRNAGENIKHGLIAGAETIASVGFVTLFNYLINQTPWALPSKESIRKSFTETWWWEDSDDFAVNQLGHPVQGLFSFGAGRANGFSFYQSVFFNTLGGFVWETFGESNFASMNDFITTATGSLATGEIFYRLYLEAYTAGLPEPLLFFINPMVSVHRLITGWKPPDTGRNIEMLQFYAGYNYAASQYSVQCANLNIDEELYFFKGPAAEIGCNVIYGNPFEQDTMIPYRQFELSLSYGLNFGNFISLTLISDGYLFSFSYFFSDTDTLSTGLTMHLDYRSMGEFSMEDSTINHYSNALDWTVKYRHLFSENASFQAKLHSGITFFGASKYFANQKVINDVGHIKKDFNNFGAGPNCKWLFALKHDKFGTLDMNLYYNLLLTFPGTTYLTHGTVNILFADIGYTYFITKHISTSVFYSVAREWGSFNKGYTTSLKSNDAFKMYVAWNL